MIWVQIILLIIRILMELPQSEASVSRVFKLLGRGRPLQIARQAHLIHAALAKKHEQITKGELSTGPCPLDELCATLEKKYGPEESH